MKTPEVYKVGSRWSDDGVPESTILSTFQAYNVVYVGDCDDKGNPVMGHVCEGDVFIIADGYLVVGVAEAVSPGAPMERFSVAEAGEVAACIASGSPVWGCRVDYYPLAEEDTFEYDKRGRACCVQDKEVREKALERLNRYKSSSSGNIFRWATSELSQDAILCWLFDEACKHTKNAPITEALLQKLDAFKGKKVEVCSVYRQFYFMDIVLVLKVDGQKHVLIVEDKINAQLHNDVEGYCTTVQEKGIEDFHPSREQITACVIRTGDGNERVTGIDGKDNQWPVIRRSDILEVIEQYSALTKGSDILQGFYTLLKEHEKAYRLYRTPAVLREDDSWAAWKGFYDYLCDKGLVDKWEYVPNYSGGFLCAIRRFFEGSYKGHPVYTQINNVSRDICLMVGEVYKDHSAERNEMVHLLSEYMKEHPGVAWQKPKRYGSGTYMTFAVVPHEKWLTDDLEETAGNVRDIDEWLHGFQEHLKQIDPTPAQ